jgi:hypothetical protein
MNKFNELNPICAPSKIKNKKSESCFDLSSLQKMVTIYNKNYDRFPTKYPHGVIKYTKEQFENKKFLLKQLKDKLEKVCDNELCWIKIDFIEQLNDPEIQYNTFRPIGPATENKKYQWLSNKDIDHVMYQYEEVYKDFNYLDTVPIDFQDLKHLKIANINFNNLVNNGINRIGVVFNLDEHTKGGSHWVSLFSDLKKKQIYFFDSYGIKPEKRIRAFMAKIANFLSNSNNFNEKNIISNNLDQIGGSEIDIRFNKIRSQFGGSECGVYSMSFILRLLNEDSFEKITRSKVPDETINKCRQYYFSH